MSNLLAMPLVTMSVETGTNEDWVDSLLFFVGTEETGPQLDLTGIAFEMEVRRRADDAEVLVRASTVNGKLAIGDAPNFGYLLINVPHQEMVQFHAPAQYVADIIGKDELYTRRVVAIDLTLNKGVTRP